MKKIISIVVSVIVLLIITLFILWLFRINLINYFLTKDFGVPTKIHSMDFSKNKLTVNHLEIHNPKFSHSELALSTKEIIFESSWQKLKADPLTIDRIQANDTLIVVEFFNKKGDQNNWSTILAHNGNDYEKGRKYLIKTLVINDLKVRLIQMDGKSKDYPVINQLVLNNISDETGFPVEEIERAIFHAVMKSIFQKLGLESLIKTLYPPNLFKKILPFFGENERAPSKQTIEK